LGHKGERRGPGLCFAVLGPVKVWRGSEDLSVGAPQQRALLAALLLRGGRTATAGELIDGIWGQGPPNQAKAALRTYASGIRKALGADAGVLVSESGGYALRWQAAKAILDVDIATALASDAEKADRLGDHDRARKLYSAALEQWDGEAMGHIPGPYAETQQIRLQEWRLGLLEHRLNLDLRLGSHAQAIAELTQLVAEFPLRERLRELLMLALYRGGRQAEALVVYDDTRRLLAEELGIDPSPELQRRHQQILTNDAALVFDAPGTASSDASSVVARRPSVPRQLPAPPGLFTGRVPELAQLSAALLPESGEEAGEGGLVVIAAVGGSGGIGKTYLALRWAHDHRDNFPDGELYVNLRGFDPSGPPVPPQVALRGFLDALRVDPAAIPEGLEAQFGLYRSLVEGKRMLIVLDNARDTAHVKDLLPGSGSCTVLVTSRSQLAGLVTENAAHSLTMDVLTEASAYELLTRRLGEERVTAEPQAIAAMLDRCGGLPLALSIVAARAAAQPHLPLAVLAEELTASADRLDALDAGEVTADLRAVFSASYHSLESEAARAFTLLGLAPGPDISLPAAASLIAATIPRTRTVLRTLETAHLIRQHTPGRYQFHDLVHLFAAERAHQDQTRAARTAALRQLADFYLHTAHHAATQLAFPSHVMDLVLDPPTAGCTPHRCADAASAREWFEAEGACLDAAHQLVREQGWHGLTWQLPAVLFEFRRLRGRGLEDLEMWQAALEAAQQLDDSLAQASAHYVLGTACVYSGRYGRARSNLEQALALFQEAGNLPGQADTHYALGRSWHLQEDHRQGIAHNRRARLLYRTTGNFRQEAICLNSIGMGHASFGNYEQARNHCEQGLAISRAAGDQQFEAAILDGLGYIAHQTGHSHRALDYYQQSLTLCRKIGLSWSEAIVLRNLSKTYLALGQFAASRQALQQAVSCSHARHPIADTADLQQHLDALDEQGTIDGAEFNPG
jgi:DNA-binding SARP family transcriptional activator